jgi:crotonobetainyl-CoA:carnitine CoA-transferase CaiB-like acyl-CoA transferase
MTLESALPAEPGLLTGIRIIAAEQYGAGPFGTQHLADLGAEVIKIENKKEGGDISRHVGPYYLGDNDSQFYQSFNRNKKSLTLDLKTPEGQHILHRLVAKSDAVFNNLRGDLPARLGLDYAALQPSNEKVVCVHLSAYGREGSRATWPGYDYLMQAEAGYLSVTGEPGSPPTRMGLSIVDLMTGTTAAMALLAGILGARATGKGRDVDVSLFDVALHNLAYVATWYLNAGKVVGREPASGHPSLTPSQLYRTKDGWIFIMCNKEKFWPVLCDKIGQADWATRPEFQDFAHRLASRQTLTEELESVLTTRTTEEWMKVFAGEVPAAPVYDVQQALDNEFVKEQERILALEGLQAPLRTIASPVRAGPHPARRAPHMGEHNRSILESAGYTTEEVDSLIARAII